MPHLFLMHIGPIQPFIASSRRTRDLSFGSKLLSELSKTAARTIIHANVENRLIFPAPLDNSKDLQINSSFSVANRILATISSPPNVLGNNIRDQIHEQLASLMLAVVSTLKEAVVDGKTPEKIATQQLRELLEIFWVAVEDDGTTPYAQQRELIEELMAARKNTRLFATGQGSSQPKSSIDGQLESIIPEHFYATFRDSYEERQRKENKLYRVFGAGPKERLSGVDLLKRLGQFPDPGQAGKQKEEFLSTSHVAALTYLDHLDKLPEGQQLEEAIKYWDEYIDTIRKADTPEPECIAALEVIPHASKHKILKQYDGGMLFIERLQDSISNKHVIKQAGSKLEKFFTRIDSIQGRKLRPSPYYAILRADGDSMGKVIDHQAKKDDGQERHRKLSQQLAAFSFEAKTIIREHNGSPIYTGGDDVLALLPLHTVLQCAHQLAESFHKNLYEFTNEEEKSATLSTGIVIVHHLSLLLESLKISLEAEHKAKHVRGKNALALILSKRSGEQYTIADQCNVLYTYLTLLIPYCLSPLPDATNPQDVLALPRGTAYEIRETAQRLSPRTRPDTLEEYVQVDALTTALKTDTLRILQRKLQLSIQNRSQDYEQAVEQLLGLFRRRLGIVIEQLPGEHPYFKVMPVSIPEFVDELIIVQEIAEAMDLSGITRKKFREL